MRCVADSLLKMHSDAEAITSFLCNSAGIAHCMHSLSESGLRAAVASRRRRCSRIIGVVTRARTLSAIRRRRRRADVALVSHGFCAPHEQLLGPLRTCTNPRNHVANLHGARNPHSVNFAASSTPTARCKKNALARNRTRDACHAAAFHIRRTTHESILLVAHACCDNKTTLELNTHAQHADRHPPPRRREHHTSNDCRPHAPAQVASPAVAERAGLPPGAAGQRRLRPAAAGQRVAGPLKVLPRGGAETWKIGHARGDRLAGLGALGQGARGHVRHRFGAHVEARSPLGIKRRPRPHLAGLLGRRARFGAAIGLYGLKLRLEDRAEQHEPGNLQFDPLGMYPVERARRKRMDEAEVKHGRIAMLAVVGYAAEERAPRHAGRRALVGLLRADSRRASSTSEVVRRPLFLYGLPTPPSLLRVGALLGARPPGTTTGPA